MSRFAPVHLPDDRHLNGKASLTFLKHYERCARSGYLYQLFKGQASTPELQRGSALHAVIERSIEAAIQADEPTIPPEIVKAIVNEVLADPAYHVPIREQDYCREAAYRWGASFAFDPGAVVALETLFVMDLGGFQVRGKIDYAEITDGGAVAVVKDWKSSRALPAFEDIARKRSDGSLAAKNMQLIVYALLLAFGVPVRVEECGSCMANTFATGAPMFSECPTCGTPAPTAPNVLFRPGRVEVPEPFGVAGRAQRFDLAFVYPGIEDKQTGHPQERPVSLSRLELEEYRASLDGILRRLAHSEASGEWDAVASDEACGECPAASLCPIPREVRDHRGRVNTPEEAADALERLYRDKADHTARQKELREFVKAHGPVRFGGGMVADFGYTESERIADKDGLWQAVGRAVEYGEPFEPADHMKRTSSTPFQLRKLTAAELEEDQTIEAEGSNGSSSGDDEQRRDERYGADAPF